MKHIANLILILSFFIINLLPSSASQLEYARAITVVGNAKQTVTTTIANVSLGVETRSASSQGAQGKLSSQSSQLVKLLKQFNVSKLKTSSINLHPQYNYQNNNRILNGYMASTNVSFEVPTKDAGLIIDKAVQSGANRVNNISFKASEESIELVRLQTLQQAAQNAQKEAETVLSALGLTMKDIVQVQVNHASPPRPIHRAYRKEALAMSSADAITPVEGGEQTISSSVTLTISY